ncbi:hypothetical protein BC332_03282 [Capsicum chinense]|nr:hypothetical protein BC332_03282 [Capsicum chinense]
MSSAKIGAKDKYHVFIDADNEEDFNNILSRSSITLSNSTSMKIMRWSTNFQSGAETTLAPVWINLPDLPWHFYEWDATCRIFSPIRTRLVLDKVTITKSRPTTAKLRIEIDLAKPLVHEVQIEVRNQHEKLDIFVQKIEHEKIPCFKCMVQGHSNAECGLSTPNLQIYEGKYVANEYRDTSK